MDNYSFFKQATALFNECNDDRWTKLMYLWGKRFKVLDNKDIKKSTYKGVVWCKTHSKWRVRRRIDGKNVHIGYYESEEEASKSYQESIIPKPNDI